MASLTEIDSLQVLVVIDNELDPALKYAQPPAVEAFGNIGQIGMTSPNKPKDRGQDCRELKMEQICCGAHGLSLMIVSILHYRREGSRCKVGRLMFSKTATKDGVQRTVLFDTGPEEAIWKMNANRLKPDLSKIDLVMLSHWHRDHSGS
jgi:7,8-dihydropterin-6-yl-methyl-4-(beta-D-ribofuranosyl)aminobenzene 5'-phosphate synthase